jgi:phosphinothricin acetyltransferase
VVGAADDAHRLLGFASYGPFRPHPAYKYTVEHSVYVDPAHRGTGIGRLLLEAIVEHARAQGYHNVVGGIDRDNAVSIRLHERLGFEHCGTVRHAGFKFGRWLDLVFYQRILDTPANPIDG